MSNLSIRGQEATLRVAVDGEVQTGSFFNVNDLTVSERGELKEVAYLGELVDKVDYQHNGWDLSFSVNVQDDKALDFLTDIVDREHSAVNHPNITITVMYKFRDGTATRVEVFYNCALRVNETSFGSRTDYIKTSFEAKAERRTVLTA
jgi:hypothetical protein